VSERPLALVTGASSGIGKEFARLLARGEVLAPHDLILVARDRARLEEVAEAASKAGVRAQVMVADLADEAGLEAVASRLASRDDSPVDLLINNAGFGVNGSFADLSQAEVVNQIRVNALAVAVLSHAALQQMKARRTGAILNVSSVAGFFPAPHSAVYAATKAFVTELTESVSIEARDFGVYVGCLAPGFTRTDFQRRAGVPTRSIPSILWAEAQSVARAGLLAVKTGRTLEVPGVPYKAAVVGGRVVPPPVLRWAARIVTERL
jgi:short-subunit dehydrogenase